MSADHNTATFPFADRPQSDDYVINDSRKTATVRANQRPTHVGIIMDGNGRWATQRGLPRFFGHRAGVETVRAIVEALAERDIDTLTLYAFSADNWQRPKREVREIFRLLTRYLESEAEKLHRRDVRLQIVGRRDRLPQSVLNAIREAEHKTRHGRRTLRVAIDYSGQEAILAALQSASPEELTRERFIAAINRAIHSDESTPPIDLVIRTAGEQRLSDFFLWECAYAELWFTEVFWPDFGVEELDRALADFAQRDRRFGAVTLKAS